MNKQQARRHIEKYRELATKIRSALECTDLELTRLIVETQAEHGCTAVRACEIVMRDYGIE